MKRILRLRHVALFLPLLAAIAGGQSTSPSSATPTDAQEQSQSRSTLPDTSSSGGWASSDEITRVLQNNPDAMVEVKTLIAEYLSQQGNLTQPDAISDQAVYSRLQSNAELRSNVSTFLRSRGYMPGGESSLETTEASAPSEGALRDENSGARGLPANSARAATTQGTRTVAGNAQNEAVPESTQMLRRDSPYNLTAYRDLYTQIPQASRTLKRFGSDAFRPRALDSGRAAASQISVDIPLGPDYVLGTGDALSIAIWGGISQSITRTIDREGKVTLPEAGTIEVAGLTLERARELLAAKLRAQYRDAQVSITISRPRDIRIYVVGDVQRPGAYEISSVSTPLIALYAAGGPTAVGSLRVLRHYRGTRLVEEIDLYDFLLHGVHAETRLQSGDTLLVPAAGPQVSIDGAVKRPAIYELKGSITIATMIADAGGLAANADPEHIRLERVTADRQRETIAANLSVAGGQAVLRDGDQIFINSIASYSSRVVYAEGHVLRPGRTPYRDGMRITDVIRSYQDLLPEPADRAEIVRLSAPDLKPKTIEFSISDALAGNTGLALQPFDTIRVFGRYEADAPRVTISGEVMRPGIYPLSDGMTATDLVRAAGGFKRDALLDSADLTSYSIENGSRVVSQRASIAIGDAMRKGSAATDVPLRAGDVLTIRQITGWNDIAASITVEGEIGHPGSYGIQQGERLSSILRRAGGFRDTAYPDGAVLVREEVRVLEEKSRQELIRQIETSSSAARLAPAASAGDQASALQVIQQQQEQVLARLKTQPAAGRLVIHISKDIASWEGTAADVEVRTGDIIRIPKRPGFVLVDGQVYNSTAITFADGKTAAWYLRRAGGLNEVANEKRIFIIRANGSVVGRDSGFLQRSVLSTKLNPGDVVVVPQKILGASLLWRNLLTTAQLASSIAITAAIAGVL